MMGILPGSRAVAEGSENFSSDEESSTSLRPKREERKSALQSFKQSFKRKKDHKTARDLIPARYIQTTQVKPNTLNPLWNEKFRL